MITFIPFIVPLWHQWDLEGKSVFFSYVVDDLLTFGCPNSYEDVIVFICFFGVTLRMTAAEKSISGECAIYDELVTIKEQGVKVQWYFIYNLQEGYIVNFIYY